MKTIIFIINTNTHMGITSERWNEGKECFIFWATNQLLTPERMRIITASFVELKQMQWNTQIRIEEEWQLNIAVMCIINMKGQSSAFGDCFIIYANYKRNFSVVMNNEMFTRGWKRKKKQGRIRSRTEFGMHHRLTKKISAEKKNWLSNKL